MLIFKANINMTPQRLSRRFQLIQPGRMAQVEQPVGWVER